MKIYEGHILSNTIFLLMNKVISLQVDKGSVQMKCLRAIYGLLLSRNIRIFVKHQATSLFSVIILKYLQNVSVS